MYVYLGGKVVIATRDVVAILDARVVPASEINRELLAAAERSGRAHGAPDAGKSIVVTTHGLYYSGLAAATVARRMARFSQSAVRWGAQTQGRTRGLGV